MWITKNKASTFYRRWLHAFQRRMYGSCMVLLYHRVTRYDTDPQLLCVTPEHFDEHLAILKQDYHVLRIDEWSEFILKRKKFPDKSVLITFDDGYADNYSEALPILEKHNLQALFYICTGNIGTDREFWWDEAERLILLSGQFKDSIEVSFGDRKYHFSKDPDSRKKFYEELLPVLRNSHPDTRGDIINSISLQVGNPAPRATHRSMTWEEVTRMSESGSAILGAHSHRHPPLATMEPEEQKREIMQSKSLLEANTGKKINHFSYPFGTKLDYNASSIRICRQSGFLTASANFPSFCHSHTDPFQIPRYLVRDWDAKVFQQELKRIFQS